MASFSAYVSGTTIYWEIYDLSNPFNTDYYEYAGIYNEPCSSGQSSRPEVEYDGQSAYSSGEDNSVSGAWSRYPGESFRLYPAVQAANGLWYPAGSSVYVEIESERPDNWHWWSYIAPGATIYISADEWNAFADRVNEFRDYKGLYPYGFTTVYSGNDIYAYMMNQARNAIDSMNPPVSTPDPVNSGDDIEAYIFNRLKDSLNSIN